MSAIQASLLRYPFASSIECESAGARLRLATFNEVNEQCPYFFEGQLRSPKRVAEQLVALMEIVHARFHVPATMLERILLEADPIVTSNDDRLRFEGFSACCGVYVRIDLFPDAIEGDVKGRGTTNVDFNRPMLNGLSKIKNTDQVSVSIGKDEVKLQRNDQAIVEKKVQLPVRWLKGLLEVQAVQMRMKRVFEINAVHALRFLRSLPRMATHRRTTWITKSGPGLRLSQVEQRNGVRVGGLERLRVLEKLARDAESLTVYADEFTGASAWVLSFSNCRFHLVISPEVWRGFSGEGQALNALARDSESKIPKVRANLHWQSIIDVTDLVHATGFTSDDVEDALKHLGSRGVVGFDLAEQACFHRELPFDLQLVEKLHPRLLAARKLLDSGKVRIGRKSARKIEVHVPGTGTEHRVAFTSGREEARCTCPWYAKHANTRSPCKHILAAQILLEESQSA